MPDEEVRPSASFRFEDFDGDARTTLDFWDRNYPRRGDEPLVSIENVDEDEQRVVVTLSVDDAQRMYEALGRWLEKGATLPRWLQWLR